MKKAKWRIEMLSEEELRRLIESLSIREIIEPALDKWIEKQSSTLRPEKFKELD